MGQCLSYCNKQKNPQSWGFMSGSTARVILGQFLSIVRTDVCLSTELTKILTLKTLETTLSSKAFL